MFSPEVYEEIDAAHTIENELETTFFEFTRSKGLHAALLVRINCESESIEVVTAANLPLEMFNGADRRVVGDVLSDCFKSHPKPHIHAIGAFALCNMVKRFSRSEEGIHRAWFVPVSYGGHFYVFLGFPKDGDKTKQIPEGFVSGLARILVKLSIYSSHKEMYERLKVMEVFVKEVGHDFASSVQATTATLRNIALGRIVGDAVMRKARQVEEEIMTAFRIADGLGIAVDPNYIIREPDQYDLIDVLESVIEHHRSEAEERRNSIKVNTSVRSFPMYGDRKAVEVAIGHLLINAIKYSFDDSYVSIGVEREGPDIRIKISNKGLPLPEGVEKGRIWDFGYRGRVAKERHVNGSGIGLYTVRKIAAAHGGTVQAAQDKYDRHISHFFLTLPIDPLEAKLRLE